jgi:hypothetical protein
VVSTKPSPMSPIAGSIGIGPDQPREDAAAWAGLNATPRVELGRIEQWLLERSGPRVSRHPSLL